MAFDRDDFIDNYLDELQENTETIDRSILALKKDPDNDDALTTLLRALHTIKGSSRMLKFDHVEKIVHGLENVFKGVKEKRYEIEKALIQLVFITTDYLKSGADKIRSERDDSMPIAPLLAVFEKAYANEPYSVDGLRPAEPVPAEGPPAEGQAPERAEAGAGEGPEVRVSDYETIRVKISKMDRIIKQFNNLIIKQFQFKKENDLLQELEGRFKVLTTAGGSAPGNGGGKDPELTRKENECLKLIQQIRKNFSTGITLLERSAFEVQEEVYSLRMLPLDLILAPLAKMVEVMAMGLEKEVEFTVSGGDIMLDKIILEKLNDPIIHILRNALDHGIESPMDRTAKSKPPAGRISVDCHLESGNIIIRVADDGKGIDYERIRRKSIALHPMQEEEILSMDDAALNAFIFTSGFSTNEKVKEISGRGVGLDIVRYNVEQIKGKITLTSERDRGSAFILTLPLSLATVEGFFVFAGGEKFLIPANFVKEISIVKREQRLDLLNRNAIKLHDKIIPIYRLATILGKSTEEREGDKLFVVVVESLGEMIGMVVDGVLQYASLIYKPLPRNLSKLKLMQGIVFDESYNIITILYIPEVMKRFKRTRSIEGRKKFSADRREYKKILVVDDSYSAREIQRSILELENYNVVTAGDGIEGLEALKTDHFHLIITDIKMPRMDGLTFVENLRQDEAYQKTPVIVISSVDDPETKQAFFGRGADAFIVKSEFDRGNLIQEVRGLIG